MSARYREINHLCKLTRDHVLNLTPCVVFVQYILRIALYQKLIIKHH